MEELVRQRVSKQKVAEVTIDLALDWNIENW